MTTIKALFSQPLTAPVVHNVLAGGVTAVVVAGGALALQLIIGAAGGCPEKYAVAAERGEQALLNGQASLALAIADDMLDREAKCGCIYILKAAASAQLLKSGTPVGNELVAHLESDCRRFANKAQALPFEQPRAKALSDSCSAEAGLAAVSQPRRDDDGQAH